LDRRRERRWKAPGGPESVRATVSELLFIAPFAPGGAERLSALLELRGGSFDDTDRVGTVHDMRFVFLDNDTKLLFATAYDGEWDPYIDDFATKITDQMDVIFSACEGWPGIRSPKVKDWIVEHQIPAKGWYVAHPDLTVRDIRRLKNIGKAVEEFPGQGRQLEREVSAPRRGDPIHLPIRGAETRCCWEHGPARNLRLPDGQPRECARASRCRGRGIAARS